MMINKLNFLILFGLSLAIFSCGGGSSGTGETESSGQIVDTACQPLGEVDLMQTGLETLEAVSNLDGSFTIISDQKESIVIQNADTPVPVDLSEPTCLILIYQDNLILNTLSYPESSLSNCSIASVKQEFPEDLVSICK